MFAVWCQSWRTVIWWLMAVKGMEEIKWIFGCGLLTTRIRKIKFNIHLLPKLLKIYHSHFLFPLSYNIHCPWCHHSLCDACYLPHIWNRLLFTSLIIRIYYCHPTFADEEAKLLRAEISYLSQEWEPFF